MKKIGLFLLLFFLYLTKLHFSVYAASPVGYIGRANQDLIDGWVRDDDYNGPVFLHIYVDGAFNDGVQANVFRSDVGNHGFSWSHKDHLASGTHKIDIFALGIDANGNLDGDNHALGNSPQTITVVKPSILEEVYFTQPYITSDKVDSIIISPSRSDYYYPTANTFLVRVGYDLPSHVTWNIGQYTGFTPSDLSSFQRGITNDFGRSAVQIEGNTVGLFINTQDGPHPSTIPIWGIIPGVWWWDTFPQRYLWRNNHNREVSFSFEMKVPYAERSNGAEIDFNPYFAFFDSVSGKSIWYGAEIFDLRDFSNYPESVVWDDGTNMANISNRWNGSSYMHQGPNSSSFQNAPWNDFKYFDFRINYDEFKKALASVKAKYPSLNISQDPETYYLNHFNLDAESYYGPDNGVGKIGLAYRNIQVALYCTQNCSPAPTPTPTPLPLPGDLNHDNKVNIRDYSQLVTDFGKTGNSGFIPSDIDVNGTVDIFDYNILLGSFGK